MTTVAETSTGYVYQDAERNQSHDYLLPMVKEILRGPPAQRIFELGCGNGSVANELSKLGYDITGIDASEQGIAFANNAYPNLRLAQGSAYDPLADTYGKFPVVLSLEVVEHVYYPRTFAATCFSLLEPNGTLILSTPYHGYWKNLALAITGKMDQHFTALLDHGHIKFWSHNTLSVLLKEAGFVDIRFRSAGRFSAMAKSMVAIARRP